MTENHAIKKTIFGIVTCFFVFLAYNAFGAATVSAADYVVVKGTNVNVRSEPNTKSKSYGKINKGTTLFRSEARADGWSQVLYNNVPAYIKTEFLAPTTADAATQATLAQQLALIPSAASVAGVSGSTGAVSSIPSSSSAPAMTTVQSATTSQPASGGMVWIPQKGSKYHSHSGCSGMKNPSQVTLDKAISLGYTACKKCY